MLALDPPGQSKPMRPPFPGMDPWLEHPALWPDVHNSLIAAIADELTPKVVPKYYVAIEQRVHSLPPVDLVSDDIACEFGEVDEPTAVRVLDVELPVDVDRHEWFLEIHEVKTRALVTVLEILSLGNKIHTQCREKYNKKRTRIFGSRTNLVEIDLLRAGKPMPLQRKPVRTDYRILISRGSTRPRAKLVIFNLRHPIPSIPIPLLPADGEPDLDLGTVLHALYDRARFDLRLNYAKPPVPPLKERDVEWAQAVVRSTSSHQRD